MPIPPSKADRGAHHAGQKLRLLIAAKTRKQLDQLTLGDIGGFATDFVDFCKKQMSFPMQRRDVDRWLGKDNSIIYDKNRQRVVAFFKPDFPFFDDRMFGLDLEQFEVRLRTGIAANSRSVIIDLPIPLTTFDTEHKSFLCGVYELYRYAFTNDGDINVDLLVLAQIDRVVGVP